MLATVRIQGSQAGEASIAAAMRSKPFVSAPFPFNGVLIGAGIHVAARSLARWTFGWKRYPGSVEAICRAVVDDCWRGQFFGGSAGHFRQFWTRDLAMCTPALSRLGQRDRVIASWAWALDQFERNNQITTTIFARRFARDVYSFACDSLPMLLHGVRSAGATSLIQRHREFLAREVLRYVDKVFDPDLGLARADRYFSAPRDCIAARSSVFANCMLALLEQILDDEPSLPNPLRGCHLSARIREHFWCGDYFRDSLDQDRPSGDANVWPFLLGIVTDSNLKRRALDTLWQRGFTRPLPLRYFEKRIPERELRFPRMLAPNYQGDTSWMQMGPLYLYVLRDINPERMAEERLKIVRFIERDQNYLEVYSKGGRPYRGRAGLYFADEGMIWAAMFLDLL
jgi:hypothetical protein